MMFEPFRPFVACEFRVKFATDGFEREGAADLRRRVFCQEQRLFERDDRDAIDDIAIPLVALTSLGIVTDEVVGTVRIHEAEAGVWWGSRLAVAVRYRKVGALGSALIRLAVTSAHARGCQTFLANVQAQNVPLFRRMHWETLDEIEIHGVAHHYMKADLTWYPPMADADVGFLTRSRRLAA